jgi:hypothetical protein
VKGVGKGLGGVGKGVFGVGKKVIGGGSSKTPVVVVDETNAVAAPVPGTSTAGAAPVVAASAVPPMPADAVANVAANGGTVGAAGLAGPAPGILRVSIARASIKGQDDAHPKVAVTKGSRFLSFALCVLVRLMIVYRTQVAG